MDASLGQRLTNWAYAELVLPFFEPRSYRGVSALQRECANHERQPLAQNLAAQWEGVQRILAHAYETTSFYRRRFDEAGVNIHQIQSPADLQKIPPVTRDDLREHAKEMCSHLFTPEQLTKAATGGTTDTPVTLYRNASCLPHKNAVQARFNTWAGFRPGDKTFFLWGAQSDYAANPSWRWRMYDQTLMRRFWAPTSVFNRRIFEDYRTRLNQMRPRVMYAYPTPLALFSEFLLDGKTEFHRPDVVICTAELLAEDQRALIEKAMGCKVFDHFGARDFGMIAAECAAHDGLHLNPHAAYIEHIPLTSMEDENLNEMLVTDLLNLGMPLIRYKVNDCSIVDSQSCSCGVGYPKIQKIMGRTSDNFFLPDGTVVSGVVARRLGNYCPGIKKLQIVQETMSSFEVKYVPGPGFADSDVQMLRSKVREVFGASVQLELRAVKDIERERSGKTRLCISKVKPATPTTNLQLNAPQ
jgi:phenylacetate-CoA ligase